ncbi:hypothetical protein [Rhizobium halophytocola]|uniref:Uncharacterized protein n=1 Tax=Rhizobium halophytocola TaxID=735519 RepID=A0ABS4DYB7_9HYPH|nr:hypothetical protein [Rhizobium halophytocola]MBP1850670.1 hypothetical protein [Rhizobium halophytocola]
MKTILIAATLGLVSSAAMAECMGHGPINAAADVDRTIVTASVATDETPGGAMSVLLRKQTGQPAERPASVDEQR